MNLFASHWTLDPDITFLNHASFGACPRAVLEAQSEWRTRIEREPVRFFVRELERALDEVREVVGRFVGAAPEDLAFVPNATSAVNAVLGSLRFDPGDEILRTSHGYNAVNNAVAYAAVRHGAQVTTANVPFPLASADEVVHAVLAAVTPRTRLAVIDHVTSPTALVLPLERIVRALAARGIDTLVDGAHGPGQVPLALEALGAAYYTGNFHKWCCAPKGSAFLHVRQDRRDMIRPHVISHGANATRTDRSRFQLEFDWMGTGDPSAVLSVPTALRVLTDMLDGGWDAIHAHNHALALAGRRTLMAALAVEAPCPDDMVASMAALPLADARNHELPRSSLYADALQDALVDRYLVQVPIIPWPAPPRRLVRISAQLYNEPHQYERLATALTCALRAEQAH